MAYQSFSNKRTFEKKKIKLLKTNTVKKYWLRYIPHTHTHTLGEPE